MDSVFARIERLLEAQGVAFEVLRHESVFTSADAARVRGTDLASGAKALVCKLDDRFVMFVVPADRRLDNKAIRREFSSRGLRFADQDEVLQRTGLTPGSIPPFGSLFDLPTYCDERLADVGRINFNAGDHAISVSISFADYAKVEQPTMGRYAE